MIDCNKFVGGFTAGIGTGIFLLCAFRLLVSLFKNSDVKITIENAPVSSPKLPSINWVKLGKNGEVWKRNVS